MTAAATLTAELRAEVLRLEDDLRARVTAQPAVEQAWKDEHREALKLGRTGASWQEWSDERVTQAAAAWALITVFVRFCEDNGLVAPVWISGPAHRRQEALDAQAQFLREAARDNPDVTDREWLLEAVGYLTTLPATAALVDRTSALWLVTPSGDAASRLLAYWRERDETGRLVRDLADPALDTRFLGDLYQDLSEAARSRYALLQTPEFVEEFILDRTLTPALAERPLEGFRLIDPTCGSGHFLLGAFARLLDRWHAHAPGLDERARVQSALDAIHGVDINPYAVAISRFRLTVAALRASGITRLADAPAFRYHLAVGDSLLHGLDQQELDLGAEYAADRTASSFAYPTENLADLRMILRNGLYDVVVGNPPYITVKDRALNSAYRERYATCSGKYALTVPFMERFFALAKKGERPGWVGQITSNSFMKREFGAPLIESFLARRDLTLVADTSGAYIPGHGTPTVIVVGRNQGRVASTVRTVLGVRGEPGRPENAAKGKVWTSIVEHVDNPGWSDEWITVADLDRALLAKHPWSLTGGGAVELKQAIESAPVRLNSRIESIGFTAITGDDDVFVIGERIPALWSRVGMPIRSFVEGDRVRDFRLVDPVLAAFPYSDSSSPVDNHIASAVFWPWRNGLRTGLAFGQTREQKGQRWWEYILPNPRRLTAQRLITFAFVATHNHFVLDRGGKVFNRSAPVIKLPEGASEDDHLALLGVLNSSTACFWLKQNSHNKGSTVDSRGARQTQVPWEDFYEFTGTTLQDYPLPAVLPLDRGRLLDGLAQRLVASTPAAVCAEGVPDRERLGAARAAYDSIRAQMVAQQEELDWEVYRLYGLVEDDLTYPGGDLPGLAPGECAFAIVLARRVAAGEEQTTWFVHHNHKHTPVTEVPGRWPAAYRDLVARRIELIGSHPYLRLLERPEHKRRWAAEPWEKQEERALRSWLLDRLEDRRFWFDGQGRPLPRSIAQLADDVARDADLVAVLALWEGRPDVPVATSLGRLLDAEAVPYLAAYRYKDSGLRKRAAWEDTWALQRREDAGEKLDGPIPVPPKYTSADFAKPAYWAHRGKLDVPKERFVLYPQAGRDTDPTPVLGWAGWDHAQQALALATLIQQREADGWPDQRLVPLVAGLAELQPWVQQWHAEPDPFYGGVSPAEFFREQLDTRSRQVGRTREQLAAWRPTPARRGRAGKATS